jgi:hypothetical protein
MRQIGAVSLVAIGACVLAGCGATKYITATETQTTSTTVTTTTTTTHTVVHRGPPITTTTTTTDTITASSPAFAPTSKGQAFSGTGTENIGPVTVHAPSELHWSCSSCGGANFVIESTPAGDASPIAVNALDQTSGQTYVDAGTYNDVTINTEGGAWSITINPG